MRLVTEILISGAAWEGGSIVGGTVGEFGVLFELTGEWYTFVSAPLGCATSGGEIYGTWESSATEQVRFLGIIVVSMERQQRILLAGSRVIEISRE